MLPYLRKNQDPIDCKQFSKNINLSMMTFICSMVIGDSTLYRMVSRHRMM